MTQTPTTLHAEHDAPLRGNHTAVRAAVRLVCPSCAPPHQGRTTSGSYSDVGRTITGGFLPLKCLSLHS